jgi:enoyl-CoA hydratase/carnithine racemase
MSVAAIETVEQLVLREDRAETAWLTMNRPSAYNA